MPVRWEKCLQVPFLSGRFAHASPAYFHYRTVQRNLNANWTEHKKATVIPWITLANKSIHNIKPLYSSFQTPEPLYKHDLLSSFPPHCKVGEYYYIQIPGQYNLEHPNCLCTAENKKAPYCPCVVSFNLEVWVLLKETAYAIPDNKTRSSALPAWRKLHRD